jgi:hypothetical protein
MAETAKQMPFPTPHTGQPPVTTKVGIVSPTPATSEPNVIDLVITVPDDANAPTTSKLRAVTTIQPPRASLKGKEKASPLAYLETVSTSSADASDASNDHADVDAEVNAGVESADSVLARQLALYSAAVRLKTKPLASSPRNPIAPAIVSAQPTPKSPAAPPSPHATSLSLAPTSPQASLKQWLLELTRPPTKNTLRLKPPTTIPRPSTSPTPAITPSVKPSPQATPLVPPPSQPTVTTPPAPPPTEARK